MKEAAANNKIFSVYVTSSSPDNSGYGFLLPTLTTFRDVSSLNKCTSFLSMSRQEMCQNLSKLGVSCTLILDSAMGYVMEQVDMVMVGAEGVAESGGVINKVLQSRTSLPHNDIVNSYRLLVVGWHVYDGHVRQRSEETFLRTNGELQIFKNISFKSSRLTK